MSSTPRTDTPRMKALMRKWSAAEGGRNGTCSPESHEIYELAEDLERELAEAQEKLRAAGTSFGGGR